MRNTPLANTWTNGEQDLWHLMWSLGVSEVFEETWKYKNSSFCDTKTSQVVVMHYLGKEEKHQRHVKKSVAWLFMIWLLTSSVHQQSWHLTKSPGISWLQHEKDYLKSLNITEGHFFRNNDPLCAEDVWNCICKADLRTPRTVTACINFNPSMDK